MDDEIQLQVPSPQSVSQKHVRINPRKSPKKPEHVFSFFAKSSQSFNEGIRQSSVLLTLSPQ
jgi:hypothetical protein